MIVTRVQVYLDGLLDNTHTSAKEYDRLDDAGTAAANALAHEAVSEVRLIKVRKGEHHGKENTNRAAP